MGAKVKNPSSAQIEELRQKFNAKYDATPPTVPFHPIDLERIRNDEVWLRRFLEMHDLDMEASFSNLWETCIWRQSYGANELTDSSVNQQYLREGSVFVHNHDLNGKPLLIFRVKLHSKSKNLDELIRIVVYWVERVQRQQHMTQLSIFFDMAGTGLATLDLEMVKRIVETFKLYYPNVLNYILVFELAWVLNAAFKVIKALLPPKAVEILKMISKKDITQYVSQDNCLTSWGGTDSYEFSFVAESKRLPPKPAAANAGADDQPHPDLGLDKKVHFAKSAPMVHDTRLSDNDLEEGMLQVEPTGFINFDPQNGEAKLHLKNISKEPVAYKIQTTSPEKFRVRPRCGLVEPNDRTEINIWLKQDHQLCGESKDKFLIMATPASGDCCQNDVTEMWKAKDSSDPDVENHRLVCRQEPKNNDSKCAGKPAGKYGTSNATSDNQLEEQAKMMERQLKFTQRLQYVTLALLFLLFAGFGFLMYQQLADSPGSCGQKAAAYSCPHKRKQ